MSSTEVPSGVRRARWTAEYKADAVAMMIDGGRSIIDVARSLGLVSTSGFYAWLAGMRSGPSAADLDEA